MDELEVQRKSLPNEPGIYFFKNKVGKIIYIGKAIDLKKRVSSYFLKTSFMDPFYEEKIKELVKEINSIEIIVTENEKEAYILENIQIKKYLPRFNVFMRDSKTYPGVAIFYGEKFPRIRVIRNPEHYPKDTLFIGPYTDKKEIIRILRDLRKIFPFCSCKKKVIRAKRPCLYYQLKLCPGPCMGEITSEEYLQNIQKIELFLKGETDELKNQIKEKMIESSTLQDFETAAFWRDKLTAIDSSTTSQSVIFEYEEDKDILGYFSDDEQRYLALLIIHIREGQIMNKSSFLIDLRKKVIKKEAVFPSIMEQYYQNSSQNLPDTIIIPKTYNGIELFKEILSDYKSEIQIRLPNNDEFGLLRIANKNARVMVDQAIKMEKIKRDDGEVIQKTLEEVQNILKLPNFPRIIEGFDISNIEGTNATGSMVYFLEGKPYKKNYRHYKIKSKSTPDDVGMMKEVIKRRYSMILEKGKTLPDLILVDGGKGQLNAGISVLKELGIQIPIIGLAKKHEHVFLPNKKDPELISLDSSVIRLFQQIRDEAHRFAIRLHKKQREKKTTGSSLDKIKGIGAVTRNKLLTHFGSLEGVKEASYDELSKLVGPKLAEIIKKELN
jgi:excinuclease ABC subunit C